MEQEIWKDVLGQEGRYRISNRGNVFSCLSQRLLSVYKRKDGYMMCRLCIDGIGRNKLAHRLVAEAFVNKPSQITSEVNHKNGNKQDNNVENLEWVTHFDQMTHAHQSNLIDYSKRRGSKCWKAKLNSQQVLEIRAKHIPWKVSFADLAKEYNVSRGTIAFIVLRKSWKDI